MKDYYALLSLLPGASEDEIKRAFRREIARYHPDKVHHLGAEFQSLAAERSAELTEAYRVLMDPGLRGSYDTERGSDSEGADTTPREDEVPARDVHSESTAPPPHEVPPTAREAQPPKSSVHDTFVRRMAMDRFRDAIVRSLQDATSMPARGFEASYLVKGRRTLFAKTSPERVLTAYVGIVTPAEITTAGQQAIAARGDTTALTVFVLGERLAPLEEIAPAVSAVRRRAPAGVSIAIVPVDVRDWGAMIPKDASANARAVIAQLRTGA